MFWWELFNSVDNCSEIIFSVQELLVKGMPYIFCKVGACGEGSRSWRLFLNLFLSIAGVCQVPGFARDMGLAWPLRRWLALGGPSLSKQPLHMLAVAGMVSRRQE
jgi:hypothetical protein